MGSIAAALINNEANRSARADDDAESLMGRYIMKLLFMGDDEGSRPPRSASFQSACRYQYGEAASADALPRPSGAAIIWRLCAMT